jgi:alpha-tubulin suppressor-like RCC1 family protein
MGRSYLAQLAAKRGWRPFTILVLLALALVVALTTILVWTSSAPALTVPKPGDRPTIAAGLSHSLAIKSDGSLWAWGSNGSGQLGDNTTEDRNMPTRIGADTGWVWVAAGNNDSLALKSDGSLWAWGYNHFGQLGDSTTIDRSKPTRIGALTDWVVVAAGDMHSLAIRTNGSLWAWGSSVKGQLGGATGNHSIPNRVGTDTNWVAAAAGENHSLALKSDGSLWAWGYNNSGQLGDGTTTDRDKPTRIGMENTWVAVAGGFNQSLAIKSDGSLWAWGLNQYGQLGDATTTNRTKPVRIGNDTDWVAVAEGMDHTLALKSDGSLWAWGHNDRGQLGDGTTTDRHQPTPIVGLGTKWVSVAGGQGYSLGLSSVGALGAWGGNSGGELGIGNEVDKHIPTGVIDNVKTPSTTTSSTTSSSTSSSTTSSSTTSSSTTTTTVKPGAHVFSDVPAGYQYHWAITDMADLGIISGYPDGTFRPDNLVLRKHFAKWIVGALEVPVSESDWQDANPPFTDCGPDDLTNIYPHDYIAVAKEKGLTQGKTASTFAPDANITRAQMVTMVVRAAQNFGLTLYPVGAGYSGLFKDYNDATHGANVKLAEYNGLLGALVITGTPSSWIAGNATRGEVAQMLWNLRILAAG